MYERKPRLTLSLFFVIVPCCGHPPAPAHRGDERQQTDLQGESQCCSENLCRCIPQRRANTHGPEYRGKAIADARVRREQWCDGREREPAHFCQGQQRRWQHRAEASPAIDTLMLLDLDTEAHQDMLA